jgi:hypothetical protein
MASRDRGSLLVLVYDSALTCLYMFVLSLMLIHAHCYFLESYLCTCISSSVF